MEAGKKTINDIFNGAKVLEIPFFQRAYVWGEEQWERFLDDMYEICETNNPHFLGSVILKQRLVPKIDGKTVIGDRRMVIDGQQRLTTLNIFFKVLCLKQKQEVFFDKTFRLIDNNIALENNHNDIEAFVEIISLKELKDINKKDSITSCYNYFKNNMDENKLNIFTLLAKVLFVGIELELNEDEQQIFDTINSLGVRLTTAELLKNFFFNKDNYSLFETNWKDVFEKDEQTKDYWETELTTGRIKRTLIDMFLFAYLQIKMNDKKINVRAEDKIGFSRVEHLFQSYKKFVKDYMDNDNDIILKEIKEYAIIFKDNFDPKIIDNELTSDAGIERINTLIFGLENTTLIPYVLYILKEVDEVIFRNELFEYIESYILRRIIVRATNKNYNQLFSDRLILNEVKTKKDFIDYLNTQTDKINFMPNDDELLEGFHNSILINKTAAGILYLIETKIRKNNLQALKLLGISKYSLEHLMPKKWENNWGKLTNQTDIDKRNRKLLTLGNLAIITQNLNSKIRDADWNMKKNGNKNDGLIAYASGLETIKDCLQLLDWNEKTIEDRADYLYNHAINIWKI